ncbi:MAG: Fatty acid desaturase family protein [Myxococcaceae bacterium]|nr:Fatty acid desaturase family protein [Myxococcaceae bacterium]
MLRNSADRRTLLWVLLAPVFVAAQYARPDWVPVLGFVSCYFALACGVIAHNHNHCATFHNKRLNRVFANYISVFYGYPTFAWIPTHNLNHHKFVNREGDATISWRFTNRHNVFVAVTYFFVSSYYQSKPINDFIKAAREKNRTLYWQIITQYAVWIGTYAVMLALAIWLHGVGTGFYVFGFSIALPAFFSLWTIMLFNYDQHAHTDPFSEHSHSRSFVSWPVNFLLFNNGYHAAHHEHAGVHWSKLPALHAEIEPLIHPSLVQRSLAWYWFKQYALSPFFPALGTVQLGPGPMNPPAGSGKRTGSSAVVEELEAPLQADLAQ